MVRFGATVAAAAVALAVAGSLTFAADASAQATPAYSGSAGVEVHHQRYREPSLDVTEEGWFGGLTLEAQAEYMLWRFKADARLAYGQMSYSGSGTVDGINDYVFEGRLTVGRALPIGARGGSRLTPYAGYGYRRLYDELGGKVTSTGALGYDRLSQYHYVPVGLEGLFFLSDSWSIRPTVEYDYFISGSQDSYLSQTGLGLGDLHNSQDSGYGVRASLMFGTIVGSLRMEFGPYFRYWKIDQSDTQPIVFAGVTVGSGFEPENDTYEAGLAVKVRF
jgi:hypothetical protein